MTSRELKWPKVTQKWRHLTGSHLKVDVEGRKLTYTVHFTSSKAVARRRRLWRNRKCRHGPQVTKSDPEVTSFDRKSPAGGCRRVKTAVYCIFHFLQGCSSQEEAVTWQKVTSRDLKWPEVTRKWRHFTGSNLEMAVEGRKPAYTVDFTSYKAVARRRRQSRDMKWRHVTSGERKWPGSDVILSEVMWKWL